MKTVIIGGVAGGMSAATRLRRLDENAEIVVLERSGYVSFANCGLPYYIGDVITDRNALLLQTPTSLKARFGIDVRVDSEAVSIDRAAKSVTGQQPRHRRAVLRGLRQPRPRAGRRAVRAPDPRRGAGTRPAQHR